MWKVEYYKQKKEIIEALCTSMKENYTRKERQAISDMFQIYSEKEAGIIKPFGGGHEAKYFNDHTKACSEPLAETIESVVANEDSLRLISTYFPNVLTHSFEIVEKII